MNYWISNIAIIGYIKYWISNIGYQILDNDIHTKHILRYFHTDDTQYQKVNSFLHAKSLNVCV